MDFGSQEGDLRVASDPRRRSRRSRLAGDPKFVIQVQYNLQLVYLPLTLAEEVIFSVVSVCLCVCVCLLRLHYVPLQWYMGYLCTIRALYAPPRRNMQHGAQGRPYFLKNSLVSIFPVTLCTTTMVYGGLVHHHAAICTTKPQCAPWCTRETIFFEKFRVPS